MEIGGGPKNFSENIKKNYGGKVSNEKGYDVYQISTGLYNGGGTTRGHTVSHTNQSHREFYGGAADNGLTSMYSNELKNMFLGMNMQETSQPQVADIVTQRTSASQRTAPKKESINLIDLFKKDFAGLNSEQKTKLNNGKLTLLDLFSQN